ncbi:hypothetical protein SAMN05216266_102318 [Amycolatopsis marina]|uniref:Uncharacterized protein n=1 Tax=Amycolatopsis marina TaxID=490629 RepID=A0A1I0WZQ2_9PSEU|nr:hypothetical protein [Amycolatopsis marina]SFA93650.1 hypothetical protein SAMN05216266_102318 [Amycolatopsis marina]
MYRIRVRWVGEDPRAALSAESDLSKSQVRTIEQQLARMDARSRHGAWTHDVLTLVAAHPERRAADLADMLGRDKDALKLDIRKLKNLGLTHSLDVGYRISPRGSAYLRARAEDLDTKG